MRWVKLARVMSYRSWYNMERTLDFKKSWKTLESYSCNQWIKIYKVLCSCLLVSMGHWFQKPLWIPKLTDAQVLYVKWLVTFGPLYLRFCSLGAEGQLYNKNVLVKKKKKALSFRHCSHILHWLTYLMLIAAFWENWCTNILHNFPKDIQWMRQSARIWSWEVWLHCSCWLP